MYLARKPLSITQSILSLLTAEIAQPKSLTASFLVWMNSNVLTITGKNNREKKEKTLNIHLSRLFLTWKGLSETHKVKILTHFRKTVETIIKSLVKSVDIDLSYYNVRLL